MVKYVIRRLIQSVPIFFGITILAYLLMTAAPGGPLNALVFANPRITPRERERLALRLGVNDPWFVQYVRWLAGDDWLRWDSDGDGVSDGAFLIPLDVNGDGEPEPPGDRKGILRGDFGNSFFLRRPVQDLFFERLPATAELGVASLLLGVMIGIVLGILAAVRRGGLFDNSTRILAVIFSAVPQFWLALIALLFFGSRLGLLPLGGRCAATLSETCPPLYERIQYLILPTLILATGPIAGYSRFVRASMLDVVNQDYIRTAYAKGLSNRVVWFKHSARNALIPVATFLGPAITGIFGGAVIIETIFAWPGVGRTALNAVVQQDYPVVMALTIYAAIVTISGYLLSDVLYAVIDPRIRFD
jgi:peptide/nickel transport system permease protein